MTARLPSVVMAIALLALAGLLGLTLVERVSQPVDVSPIRADIRDTSAEDLLPADMPEWQGLDAASLTAIVEAPLFIEGRRMPDDIRDEVREAEAAPEPQPAPSFPVEEPDVALRGVLITSSESKALLSTLGSGAENWVMAGDEVGDWKVAVIAGDHVILRHQDQERRLDLHAVAQGGNRGGQ
ncbi:hypothetical protein [Breoghania sp.]|uniref:hypothetical protein n=1 Tax=Breoghania sp. TaxID=2065378 RepID=UPI002AA723E8|nr:hypothetical protein [Breoghania sp.]